MCDYYKISQKLSYLYCKGNRFICKHICSGISEKFTSVWKSITASVSAENLIPPFSTCESSFMEPSTTRAPLFLMTECEFLYHRLMLILPERSIEATPRTVRSTIRPLDKCNFWEWSWSRRLPWKKKETTVKLQFLRRSWKCEKSTTGGR